MIGNIKQLEQKCLAKGLKMTAQRRVICKVLAQSHDHPHVDALYERVQKIDNKISIATIYRTLRLFEEAGILMSHDFGMGRAHYEISPDNTHHDHMIDVETGEVIEFTNKDIEQLQEKICEQAGYQLIGHRLELYVCKKK
ncbi:MAG: transcriptional repressor [Alphaproteobacteria bacterium]|nr:transcriptional repressor [Alphaproteobacteria bacterium]